MAAIPSISAIVTTVVITVSAIVASNIVLTTISITGATIIGAASLPVARLRVATVLLQSADFIDVLDGISQFVDGLQITGRHFGLAGNLVQFVLELILQVI
jgi:hypothetical protein